LVIRFVDNYKIIYTKIYCRRRLLINIRVDVRDFDDFGVFWSSAIMRSECQPSHDQAAGAFCEQRPEIAFRQARADCGVELQEKK